MRNSGIVGGTDAVIRGNRINAPAGITLLGCRTSTIADNWVVRGGIKVAITSETCTFEGNTLDGSSIEVGDTDMPSSDNVVRRNVVRGGGSTPNTWTKNRFVTACGAATG